jgi:hypothetical protein
VTVGLSGRLDGRTPPRAGVWNRTHRAVAMEDEEAYRGVAWRDRPTDLVLIQLDSLSRIDLTL